MRAGVILALVLFALASQAGAARAQEAEVEDAVQQQPAAGGDADAFAAAYRMRGLAPPANLAAGALGVGADSITPVTAPAGLATTLLSGIGPDGRLKGALGLSFTPFTFGAKITVEKYRRSLFNQWLARSGVSVALSQGESEDSDGSIAIGVQTVLFDGGDLLIRRLRTGQNGEETSDVSALVACTDATRTGAPRPQRSGQTQSSGPVRDSLLNPYAACAEALRRASWNDSSLGVGLVFVSRAEDNVLTNISRSNTIGYVSATYGFEGLDRHDDVWFDATEGRLRSDCDDGFHLSCNAQIVFQLKYQSDAVYEVPVVGEATGESWAYGVKFVAGSERSVGYALYRREDVEFSFGDREVTEYAIGFETRLGEKLWLNISAGRRDDEILGEENTVGASVSWDLLDAASLFNPFARSN